jgi:hypothetical protein
MSERAFPIIYVDDVPTARAFYEALGFSQTYRFPAEGEPDYVTMSRAGSSIGIGASTQPARIASASGFTSMTWIPCSNGCAPQVLWWSLSPKTNPGGRELRGSGTPAVTSSTWVRHSEARQGGQASMESDAT